MIQIFGLNNVAALHQYRIHHGSCGVLLALGLLTVHLAVLSNRSFAEEPLSFVAPKVLEMRIGIRITPGDGNMLDTRAQTVFPTDWPEQTVQVLDYTSSPLLNASFRDLPGNNRQLIFFAPLIQPGAPVEVVFRVRIEKRHIVGPVETGDLVVPRRVSSKLKQYLGAGPYIDPNYSEIRRIVKEIDATEPANAWKKVELLYDWVRDNIAYENGELKTVHQALRDRTGDCEEMTSIFVALCRASRIPARCVWIPNHCYPEFYLEDGQGEGHWFPCQVAGTRNFGSMPEYLPILQKGDRFKVPDRKEVQRYLADYLSSKTVTGQQRPKVEFIRQLLDDANQPIEIDSENEPQNLPDDTTPQDGAGSIDG